MDSSKSTGVSSGQVVVTSAHQVLTDQQQQEVAALALQLCPSSSTSGYAISTGLQGQTHQIQYQQMSSSSSIPSTQTQHTIHLQLPVSSSAAHHTLMLQPSTTMPLVQLTNGQGAPVSGQNAVSFVVPPTAALVQGQGTGAFFIPFPGQQGNALTVQPQILQQGQQLHQMSQQPQQVQIQQQAAPAPAATGRNRKKSTPSTGGGLNAYAVFTKDIRQRLVEQHPEATFSDLAKITGVEWRSLSEAQKAVFREKARHMQEEAQAQLQRNKQAQVHQQISPHNSQQTHIQVQGGGHQLFDGNSQFDASSIDFSSFLSSPAVINSRSELSQPQQVAKQGQANQNSQASTTPHGPVQVNSPTSPSLIKPGARNGFILFSKELRPKLKIDFPNASFGELSKLTGVEWKKLNDQQKREWEERAFKLAEEKHQRKPVATQMQAGPSHHDTNMVHVQPISSDAKVLDILGQAAQLLGLAGPLTQQHHHAQQPVQDVKPNVHVQDPKQWSGQQVVQQPSTQHHQYHQHEPVAQTTQQPSPLWTDEAPPAPTPQKKPAKKRAPRKRNPPTGTGSGYVLFAKEIRSRVKEEHPEATFGEIGKYTGAEWAKISHEEKVEWGIKMDQLLESKGKKPMRAKAAVQVHPPEPKPSHPPGSVNQRMFSMETSHSHV